MALCLTGAFQASAQVGLGDLASGSSFINEDHGLPGVCAAPCYVVEKTFDVFSPGAAGNPGVCGAGENTFVYSLANVGGTIPFPGIPITEFEATVDFSLVATAGSIPGPGIAPTSTTVSPLNVVSWQFPLASACPACLIQGTTSELLYICAVPGSSFGSTPDNVSTTAIFLDAPGTCVVPVQGAPSCDLEIDKTCCIPPAAVPSLDQCEGKVVRMEFEYLNDDCTATTNDQEGKAQCSGGAPGEPVDVIATKDADKIIINPDTGINVPDTFEVSSIEGELKASTKLEIQGPDDDQSITIHTSCSKPLSCGDQFGSLRLVELETTEGGIVNCADPAPEGVTMCIAPDGGVGTACTDKLVEIVFEYTGEECQNPLPQSKADCSGDPMDATPVSVIYTGKDADKITVSPGSMITLNDSVSVTATGTDTLKASTKLEILDGNGVVQALTVHTSCSEPLALGQEFGALKVVGFLQEDGQEFALGDPNDPIFQDACQIPGAPAGPHCTSKVLGLSLRYLAGETCSVTNDQDGKASCVGDDLTADDVSITITKDASDVSATPDSGIDDQDVFVIAMNDKSSLKASTKFDAMDGAGNTQSIEIHTSCSQPLNLGDRFGNFEVFAIERKDEGVVSLGGMVEYQYTVTNPNAGDATVDVDDDILGNIVMGGIVPGGDSVTYFKKATLESTTTNTATVMGEVDAAECTEDDDSVTVTVTPPPPGPFDCSDAKPIDELSMIWDGLVNIKIVAHDGDTGSPILSTQDNIAPSDEVTVSGMGGSPNDQVWEIFEAGTNNLIGTSKFHISCSDSDMNGTEDCGKNEGNGKGDEPALVNDWLLEAIVGAGGSLNCTP